MKADLAPLATDRQCSNISSSMTSLVSSMPSATMARLSPTSITSMPAASATCAEGKSCAVIMLMGSPFRYMAASVCTVTFRRGVAGGVPSGECDELRVWVRGLSDGGGGAREWTSAGGWDGLSGSASMRLSINVDMLALLCCMVMGGSAPRTRAPRGARDMGIDGGISGDFAPNLHWW